MRATLVTTSAAALALGLLALAVPSAQAQGSSGGSGDVRTSGSCSASTDWKLKAKPDNGRIEVEFEVDSNVSGQTWAVTLTDNGARVFAGTRMTAGPSGSFTVQRRIANRAGADSLVATAMNSATGETCRGGLTLA